MCKILQILRGDVDIDQIRSLKVASTTWKLFLEEAPEAFEVIAYDDQGMVTLFTTRLCLSMHCFSAFNQMLQIFAKFFKYAIIRLL